jgi:hypothetical protein
MDAARASIGCETHFGREEVALSSALNHVFRESKRVWAWVGWWAKFSILLGFLRQNVLEFEQNRKKPEKTCGNQRIPIDKALGKDEGELR